MNGGKFNEAMEKALSKEGTIKMVHSRVDKIEASIKTVKSVGVAISGAVATFSAWLGISSK